MPHKKGSHAQESMDLRQRASLGHDSRSADHGAKMQLEIVLKSDSFGSSEAINDLVGSMKFPDCELKVIHSGVGPISKSDLQMAMTGSKLVIGFNVTIMPKLDQWIKEHGAEVRLYKIIYTIAEDLKRIVGTFAVPEAEEHVTGKARVIARFKSSHRGIILGCEVLEGVMTAGKNFRVISAMGPVYTGKIESLHIERDNVKEAKVGQQVGLKISEFNRGNVGDLVECFEHAVTRKSAAWRPGGSILRFDA